MKTCISCHGKFTVAEEDKKFYEKMDVPEPIKCPLCRQQRRLSFRNEINFFKRKCDKSGQEMLTIYDPAAPYKVYDHEEWWKDDWDPLDYGHEFSFNEPFFAQFKALMLKVPRMFLNVEKNENSYYTNYSSSRPEPVYCEKCYLEFAS